MERVQDWWSGQLIVDRTEVLFLWARKTVLETSLIRTKTSHAPSRDQNRCCDKKASTIKYNGRRKFLYFHGANIIGILFSATDVLHCFCDCCAITKCISNYSVI